MLLNKALGHEHRASVILGWRSVSKKNDCWKWIRLICVYTRRGTRSVVFMWVTEGSLWVTNRLKVLQSAGVAATLWFHSAGIPAAILIWIFPTETQRCFLPHECTGSCRRSNHDLDRDKVYRDMLVSSKHSYIFHWIKRLEKEHNFPI